MILFKVIYLANTELLVTRLLRNSYQFAIEVLSHENYILPVLSQLFVGSKAALGFYLHMFITKTFLRPGLLPLYQSYRLYIAEDARNIGFPKDLNFHILVPIFISSERNY